MTAYEYNAVLSELHLRVWQEELGLVGSISEIGHIQFGRQGPGTLTILLTRNAPDRATINFKIVDDYYDIDLTTERVLEICNGINDRSTGAMLVDSAGAIEANLHLFFLPLDESGALPDEGFLRAWIGPGMSEIEKATEELADELKQ